MTSFPLDLVVKSSVVLAAAALLHLLMRRRGSAAARHLVWSVAMGSLLVLPVATLLLPPLRVVIPVSQRSDATVVVEPRAATPGSSSGSLEAPAPSPRASRAPVTEAAPFDVIALAVILYFAGVIVLLARLIVEQFALRRLAAVSRIVTDPAWQRTLDAAARQMRVRRPIRLLEGAGDVMPLTFWARKPVVIVPGAARLWDEERRRAVLLHEVAHVARHDCLTQRLAAVACAVYWPHPVVWWAARRLRVERELACDDRVLAAGAGAREYAQHLLDIAHSLRRAPAPATALAMARARHLESRLLAVLDTARNRAALRRRGRMIAVAVSLLVLPIAALHAALVPSVSGGRAERPTAASALTAPEPSGVLDQSTQTLTSRNFSGTWEIRLSRDGRSVHVSLRTEHSQNGMTLPLDRFEGLSASQISQPGGAVRFSSRREAGTFQFEGVCRSGLCGGTYTFAPDAAFASQLAARGIGTPSPDDLYELAMNDVGLAFVDELKAQGYKTPEVRGLVRASAHGVNLGYVRNMGELGYHLGSVDQLILLRDHGVDPDFVRGLTASGLPRSTPDQLVRLRDHGVDPPYVQGMRGLGYGSAAVDDLVKARDHGVDPAYARGLADLGYRNLPLDALVRLRDHGVDPVYVSGLAGSGYKNLPADALIRLRDHGVDPAYVTGMAELGYKGLDTDTLVRMRDHGVDPAYVRGLKERGVEHLSVDDLIRRRDRGDDDPTAALRGALGSLWTSLLSWLRG